MATGTAVDISIWEKIGDGFSLFAEGLGRFLTRLLGASNERIPANECRYEVPLWASPRARALPRTYQHHLILLPNSAPHEYGK